MKKTLRLSILSMLMLFTGNAMADTVTFDFNTDYATLFPTIPGTSSNESHDGDFTETTTSIAINGVTVTVSPADDGVTNANRIWSTNPRLRMYSGTITFTSTGENITKMVLTRSTNSGKVANNNTADSGELGTSDQQTNAEVTWTGNASSVTITIAGNTQFSKAVVTVGQGGDEPGPDPNAAGTLSNPYTVAQAFELLATLDVNVKSDVVYAKGRISQIVEVSPDFGNATYYISDDGSTNGQLEVYRGKYLKNTNFTAADQIKVGDEVIVTGQLVNFRRSSDGDDVAPTPEFTQGNYIYSLNGQTELDVQVVTVGSIREFAALANGTVAELTLNNAQVLYVNEYNNTKELFVRDATGAIDLYNLGIDAEAGQLLSGTIKGQRGARSGFTVAMLNSDSNPATVSVGGSQSVEPIVLAIDEATTAYVCDLIQVNNVPIVDGKASDDGVELALYDRFNLGVTGKLKPDGSRYNLIGLMYDGGTTYGPELVVIRATNADGSEIGDDPVELTGDGSESNPYTVADLKSMAVPADTNPAEGQEKVWVKGFIAGALNSSGSAFAEDVPSNIALATAAGETTATNCVPVQLPVGAVRAALNVVDNPGNVGKEVLVYGHILKYMSKTGVKNVTETIIDGAHLGINDVTMDAQQGKVYNLAGQQMSDNVVKGVYIVGNKKVIK